ncbi:alpha-amylase family glycosyl hydrolase [Cellulomonas soli]|uniref:Alpha-amylase n=1 Tax=Cellulomonas soli TaxID=931535 RepID=A0A512PCU7_9CELL|nr:alpha-amylase family glycosyl hydrolase [Cellulomonas soli]NYI58527.1 cyclomaltodextrinase [Cellulomonas soli]GEP68952.1 alpha-amylase [Cellulomonas soli]
MSWSDDCLWWHVYPLGFVGAAIRDSDHLGTERRPPLHHLDHLERWLDHVVDLGLNGLALGPVFASTSHGYDTVDHLRVDPRLGDEDDLRQLFQAAHDRGVRVLLDGVFNHVGRDFPQVRAALADPTGDAARWFRHEPDGRLAVFEGHDGLVLLDHDAPEVVEHVTRVMTHWLDQGADGWRLDAAYATPARFWATVLPRVRAAHPDAYVVGEVIHGDYAAIVQESTVDSLTQYELWKSIWSSLRERNFFELDWTLTRHDALLDTFVPWTFVGNHDVTRIVDQVPDARHHPHAHALLLLLAGTPAVYYGDEIGLHGVKEDRLGGDDAVRPAYPDAPGAWTPEQQATIDLHRRLVSVRRRHPWLRTARSRSLVLENELLVLELTARDGEDGSLVLALSTRDEPARLDVGRTELLAGDATRHGDGWQLPAHAWAVLR